MAQVDSRDFQINMVAHFDRIEQERTELVVTRQNHETVVVVAQSEWERMRATLQLLSTPADAASL